MGNPDQDNMKENEKQKSCVQQYAKIFGIHQDLEEKVKNGKKK